MLKILKKINKNRKKYLTVNFIKYFFFKRGKIKILQNLAIKNIYSKDLKKIIVFFVPGEIEINGGIMSICSIAKVTKNLKKDKECDVIIVTLPKTNLRYEYIEFETEFKIFRFSQIFEYFHKLEDIEIHLPEFIAGDFNHLLKKEEIKKLLKIKNKSINILNQNIKLMPDPCKVNNLLKLTPRLTMTIAHKNYCNEEMHLKYKMPIHMYSADYLADYKVKKFIEKRNLIIYSPDKNKYKKQILDKLRRELFDFEFIEIKNMKYKEYLSLIANAKYSITFGEGLDGYFLEPIRCGGISFAVFNEEFFSNVYKGLSVLYKSYDEMLDKLVCDIKKIDNLSSYDKLSQKLFDVQALEYNRDEYIDNIEKYYNGDYTYK